MGRGHEPAAPSPSPPVAAAVASTAPPPSPELSGTGSILRHRTDDHAHPRCGRTHLALRVGRQGPHGDAQIARARSEVATRAVGPAADAPRLAARLYVLTSRRMPAYYVRANYRGHDNSRGHVRASWHPK